MSKPKRLAIEPDDHHARHAGHLPDGRQFFLTTPFVPAIGAEAGRELRVVRLQAREDLRLRTVIDAELDRLVRILCAASTVTTRVPLVSLKRTVRHDNTNYGLGIWWNTSSDPTTHSGSTRLPSRRRSVDPRRQLAKVGNIRQTLP